MWVMILKENKLLGRFSKKNCIKQIKENLELKKQQRGRAINYMLNGRDTIICLTAG